tara:strand:- start:257 stop:880 length:624 start_codon:yes stop_codon:yes gene_type:complete
MLPSYYAIIPAEVRYSRIKPSAKLLYGEITCLTHKTGYCFATNNYFAELYNVSKNTISLWVKDLKDAGFIKVEIIYGKTKEVKERRICITKNDDTLIIKNGEDNNTRINITRNNIYIKEKFINQVMYFDYPKEIKQDFIDYWTEGKNKMRFEKQSTFEIKLRLERWLKNSKKWNSNNISKVEKTINSNISAKMLMKNLLKNQNTIED